MEGFSDAESLSSPERERLNTRIQEPILIKEEEEDGTDEDSPLVAKRSKNVMPARTPEPAKHILPVQHASPLPIDDVSPSVSPTISPARSPIRSLAVPVSVSPLPASSALNQFMSIKPQTLPTKPQPIDTVMTSGTGSTESSGSVDLAETPDTTITVGLCSY